MPKAGRRRTVLEAERAELLTVAEPTPKAVRPRAALEAERAELPTAAEPMPKAGRRRTALEAGLDNAEERGRIVFLALAAIMRPQGKAR